MAKKTAKIQYPKIGKVYTHYKGGKYEVITMATHSEDADSKLVIYKSVIGGFVYARPLHLWFDLVDVGEAKKKPRFQLSKD